MVLLIVTCWLICDGTLNPIFPSELANDLLVSSDFAPLVSHLPTQCAKNPIHVFMAFYGSSSILVYVENEEKMKNNHFDGHYSDEHFFFDVSGFDSVVRNKCLVIQCKTLF